MLCVTSQNLIECWAVCTRPVEDSGLGLLPALAVRILSRIETAVVRLAEALILQRMKDGAFSSAEDLILHALPSSNAEPLTSAALIAAMQAPPHKENIAQLDAGERRFALMAWLLDLNILAERRQPRPEPTLPGGLISRIG